MNDCVSLSFTTKRRSSCRTGEAADPQPLRNVNGPIGFDQTGRPVMSNTNTPRLAKYA